MNGIINAISAFAAWLLSLFGKVFAALWSFVLDVLIEGLDQFLTGFAYMISIIPAPDFLSQHSLQSAFSGLSGDVLFSSACSTSGRALQCLARRSPFAWRARL
ncbi:DUF2523 domain-containing protein [Cupriavidus basilensis]